MIAKLTAWAGHRFPVRDERLVDVVLAGGIFILALVEAAFQPAARYLPGLVLLMLAYSVPLVWRRRWPVVVLAVVITSGVALGPVAKTGGLISYVLAALLAAYTAGRVLDAAQAWWAPAVLLAASCTFLALFDGGLSDFVFVALLYGGAWAVGMVLRRREQRISALQGQADTLREAQTERARAAVAQERARIARELHDIVSHSISVITIQAQALRLRLPAGRAEDAHDLHMIETTARQAMAEMRRLLGVLRADGAAALDLAPQPGLADLPALLRSHETAGGTVRHTVKGTPAPLPPGLDLTAYRVIQEALTNCRKHAEPGPVAVRISYTAEAVTLTIEDRGPDRAGRADTAGYGLAGMAERVTLFGGTLDAGPCEPAGWLVRARLPLSAEAAR